MHYSPLRYPGGKNKLSPFIAKMCVDNNISDHYIEPYSGGASVALFLLMEGFVKKITINDKDRSLYAFWHAVLNNTDELCRLINDTEINLEQWKKQKEIQANKIEVDLLQLGFSTFFLNRTNHSGIISGGLMGGIAQKGAYLMDCRFNKPELINRIQKIALKRDYIKVYQDDALKLIDNIQLNTEYQNSLLYFDPPYYYKANSLYMNHYEHKHHKTVSEKIKCIKDIHWIVSYDNVQEIKDLYTGYDSKEYSFKHTAHRAKIGREILFFSPNFLKIDLENKNPVHYKIVKNKSGSKIVYKRPKLSSEEHL